MWDQTEDANASYETEPTDYYGAIREEAVRIAEQELLKDTRETGANNRGSVIDIYLRNANALKKDTDPSVKGKGWCGMFVYYCYSQAAKKFGMSLPFKSGHLWNGRHLREWSQLHQNTIVAQSPLLPGDIYIIGDNHVGMIFECLSGDSYRVIEGNQTGLGDQANGVQKNIKSLEKFDSLVRI